MRASYAGWAALNLEEAERLGELSAEVTHDHPLSLKAARAVAGSMAEVYFPIPRATRDKVAEALDEYLVGIVSQAARYAIARSR